MNGKRWLGFLLLLAMLALAACGRETSDAGAVRLTLDGKAWAGGTLDEGDAGDWRVYVTLDGAPLCDLPFSRAHTLAVIQEGVGQNVIALTGESVCMESADCDNQDCVLMGAVTRDNLELRVLGGFIVCLPHRLSVEVRGD